MGKHWDPALYEAQHSFVWQYGSGLIDLLAVQPGEHVLDLGCGTGQLSAAIAEKGAHVLGVDASPEMLAQARQNYPNHSSHGAGLRFVLADAERLSYAEEFDAVFSNAALHWMKDLPAVSRGVAQALKPGGRLVLECGAPRNISTIETALSEALHSHGWPLPQPRTYFRGIGLMSSAFEDEGLEVSAASIFDRPTPLDGENGMARWMEQFAAHYLEMAPQASRATLISQACEALRPVLHRDGAWFADYRRLRLMATRTTRV